MYNILLNTRIVLLQDSLYIAMVDANIYTMVEVMDWWTVALAGYNKLYFICFLFCRSIEALELKLSYVDGEIIILEYFYKWSLSKDQFLSKD